MSYRLIAVDDTKYWSDEIRSGVDKIYTRYVYNDTECTYCCELTPSRCLFFVGFSPTGDVSEELAEKISEEECNFEDVCYMHCSFVDKKVYTVISADDLEEAIEYARCNECLPEGLAA
jgi:hypothetical protein